MAFILITSFFTVIDSIEVFSQDKNLQTREEMMKSFEPIHEVSKIKLSNGDEWIAVDSTVEIGTPSEIIQLLSDTMGITLLTRITGFWTWNVTYNGTEYDIIDAPGMSTSNIDGLPKIPRISRYIEIPHDVDIELNISSSTPILLSDYNVLPSQPSSISLPNTTNSEFIINNDTYETNSFYPLYNATTSGELSNSPIILRGRRLLHLSLYPIQFNPISNQLMIYPYFQIRIKYHTPSQIQPVNQSLICEPYESIFRGLLLNYQESGESDNSTDSTSLKTEMSKFLTASYPTDGAEYLIIVDPAFVEAADRLAAWKTRKGLFTKVYTTEFIKTGSVVTWQDIRSFIETAYFTWNPAPAYVLLFGDSEHIPCNYSIVHTATFPYNNRDWLYHGANGRIASDVPYFTLEGNDYLPEIIHGRISVDSLEQANNVVAKILTYEINPPIIPDFYSNILVSSYFQDEKNTLDPSNGLKRDGMEEEPFVITTENLSQHLIDNYHYNIYKCYRTNLTPPEVVPLFLYDGTPVDSSLYWQSGSSNVVGNISAGKLVVFHIDHGNSQNFFQHDYPGTHNPYGKIDGWGAPSFTTNHIPSLTNTEGWPLVLSMDCNCGWFDGEIDQDNGDDKLVNDYECFSENITRIADGGAIAVISTTRISYNIPSADLLLGVANSFWPGNLPTENDPLYNMGAALVLAKGIVANAHEDGIDPDKKSNITLLEYHLFGDPETSLWTSLPKPLEVNYPTSIGTSNSQKFVVTVKSGGESVFNAKICLQKDGDIYEVEYTDVLGQACFDIDPSSAGTLNLTVTKHDYVPELHTISIIESDASLTVSPDRGEYGDLVTVLPVDFDTGELVDILFNNTLYPDIAQTGDDITVPDGPEAVVNIVATGKDSGYVAVTTFTRVVTPGPDPYLYSQWAESTWILAPDHGLHWNNPCIQLYDADHNPVASNNLYLLENYTIEVSIYNNVLDIGAPSTTVEFRWAHFGAGQRTWNLIDTDTIDVPPGADASPTIAKAHWVPTKTGHCCLKVIISTINDENPNNNEGQENTNVHGVSSPGEVNFTLENPKDFGVFPYLQVIQMDEDNDVWEATILNISSDALDPTKNRSLVLWINPPPDLVIGDSNDFMVNLYINGELINGFMTTIIKQEPTTTPPPPPPYCDIVLIVVFVAAVIIIIIIICIICKWKYPPE